MAKSAKTNAMRFLEAHGVAFTARTYACDAFVDGVTMAQKAQIPAERTFKTLVAVATAQRHVALAIPVAEALDLKKAAVAVGEKSLSLLPVRELLAVTGYARGGCTVVGMKRQLVTAFDASALDFATIFLSGGRVGAFIEVDPRDIARVIGATFADLLLA